MTIFLEGGGPPFDNTCILIPTASSGFRTPDFVSSLSYSIGRNTSLVYKKNKLKKLALF